MIRRAPDTASFTFSLRTDWPEEANPLFQGLESRMEQGGTVLNLTTSNPTQRGFRSPADERAILRALSKPADLRYEPEALGRPGARRALARWLARRQGAPVSPDQLLLTASSSESYAFLFKLLANPGDEILVPTPSYPLLEFLSRLDSVRLRTYRLDPENGWALDRESILEGLRSYRVRALLVVHPNNPTGSFLGRGDMAFVQGLAAERGIAVISDEVFADYALRPDRARASSAAVDASALTFALGGLSKAAGLPQLKLGWIQAAGPDDLVAAALSKLDVIADTYLSVGTPVQEALPELLRLAGKFQRDVRALLQANLNEVRRLLPPGVPLTALFPEAGWSLPLRLPSTRSGEEWALWLLEQHGLLVQPGYFYDFASEAIVVVSLLTPQARFKRGMSRLIRAVADAT
jgi:aspartate/methionine/tyrosine aminotransferase